VYLIHRSLSFVCVYEWDMASYCIVGKTGPGRPWGVLGTLCVQGSSLETADVCCLKLYYTLSTPNAPFQRMKKFHSHSSHLLTCFEGAGMEGFVHNWPPLVWGLLKVVWGLEDDQIFAEPNPNALTTPVCTFRTIPRPGSGSQILLYAQGLTGTIPQHSGDGWWKAFLLLKLQSVKYIICMCENSNETH
jgi:hypothetical protein